MKEALPNNQPHAIGPYATNAAASRSGPRASGSLQHQGRIVECQDGLAGIARLCRLAWFDASVGFAHRSVIVQLIGLKGRSEPKPLPSGAAELPDK